MTTTEIQNELHQLIKINVGDGVILTGIPETITTPMGELQYNPLYNKPLKVEKIDLPHYHLEGLDTPVDVADVKKHLTDEGVARKMALQQMQKRLDTYNSVVERFKLPSHKSVTFKWESFENFLERIKDVESWYTPIPTLFVSYRDNTIKFNVDRNKVYTYDSIWGRRSSYSNLNTLAERAIEKIDTSIARKKRNEEHIAEKEKLRASHKKLINDNFPTLSIKDSYGYGGVRGFLGEEYYPDVSVVVKGDEFQIYITQNLNADQVSAIVKIIQG